MKALLCASLVLLAASVPVARQFSSGASADESRILALENAWGSAEQQKDIKVLDELLSNSLSYTDSDGTFMNKSELLKSIASPDYHPQLITYESAIVHTYGSSAIVIGIYREKGSQNGKAYSRRCRFTDTWVNEGGVWRCVASQSTLAHQ